MNIVLNYITSPEIHCELYLGPSEVRSFEVECCEGKHWMGEKVNQKSKVKRIPTCSKHKVGYAKPWLKEGVQ